METKNKINMFQEANKRITFFTQLYNSLCHSCRSKLHSLGIRYKNNPDKLKECIDAQMKRCCSKCQEVIKLYEAKYK